MKISIEHIALWTQDLDRAREFYRKYFGAESNKKYINPGKGLETYFLTFPGGGPRLELMKRPEVTDPDQPDFTRGYAHVAFSLGSKEKVDALTARLVEDGYHRLDGPRTTGDGYYEATFHDPDGNTIELTV